LRLPISVSLQIIQAINLWLEEQRIEKERLEKIERDKQLQELEKRREKELHEFKALLIQSRRWQKINILDEGAFGYPFDYPK
jgi:uncharacterized protein YaiL (DUF2058 family)